MFDVDFGDEFTLEYSNFPKELQDAIQDFIDLFLLHGLGEHTKPFYKGKLSYSWRNLENSDPDYIYTKSNHLWHYHIGIPTYIASNYGSYYTSDMVLHFVWKKGENSILIVDCTDHYKSDGSFWLPSPKYLVRT